MVHLSRPSQLVSHSLATFSAASAAVVDYWLESENHTSTNMPPLQVLNLMQHARIKRETHTTNALLLLLQSISRIESYEFLIIIIIIILRCIKKNSCCIAVSVIDDVDHVQPRKNSSHLLPSHSHLRFFSPFSFSLTNNSKRSFSFYAPLLPEVLLLLSRTERLHEMVANANASSKAPIAVNICIKGEDDNLHIAEHCCCCCW